MIEFMRNSCQSFMYMGILSYLCSAKKGRDGLCHQRTINSDWASSPARVCQESDAQACPPAVYGLVDNNTADTVQLTYPLKGKTVIPFTTHEGSGLANCVEDVKDAFPGANVTKGFSMLLEEGEHHLRIGAPPYGATDKHSVVFV